MDRLAVVELTCFTLLRLPGWFSLPRRTLTNKVPRKRLSERVNSPVDIYDFNFINHSKVSLESRRLCGLTTSLACKNTRSGASDMHGLAYISRARASSSASVVSSSSSDQSSVRCCCRCSRTVFNAESRGHDIYNSQRSSNASLACRIHCDLSDQVLLEILPLYPG